MTLSNEVKRILGCLAHDIYSITCSNECNKMDKIVDQATSKIMELIKQDQEALCDICYGEKK